ncbi:MAG: metalloregulator ArsR/SmtB family transcription factor [Ignavibacteria bacterium]|nr:metalloregulator ArsR/SmtB family transcription factor [Ignavibacteria bacterium]MDP3830719.1 metalloregulator ArsR/SmtB family transcription factor [Ignavibacteriaceae bacterium]
MEEKVKFFKALSDSNRLRILKMLQTKPLCVCEITNVLELATSTVSQHLKLLKEAGFIIEEKEGKWVNYYINPKPADTRVTSLLTSLDFWIADQDIIISDKMKVVDSDRNVICAK